MKKIACCIMLLSCMHYYSHAQVGIGTTSPTAELEIVTSNGGIPALEINPQTAPTGTVTGQVSLIGDKLYMYDATRTKWLSLETPILQFGRSGNQDNTSLRSAGNVGNNNSGILMPFDGTITCITAKTNSNNGAQVKQFTIRVRNGISNVSTMNITTAASLYTNTTCNLDFSAGDYINAVIANDGNGNVNNSTIALWIKWRQ